MWALAINNPTFCFQKITTKNAFGLHLIDFMLDILKQKDAEPTNFKVRSMFTVTSVLTFGGDGGALGHT